MTDREVTLLGPTHNGLPVIEPNDENKPISRDVRDSMSPEDRKVEMTPTQVRKAGRKTRRRKTRRGGGLGENSATWPPDKSSFGPKIGSPENTDNLIGYGGKRRRSLKRK